MIVCCGEALIDFMPTQTLDGAKAFQPFNGGSIYNVAIALGRLGQSVSYLGGLSEDFFGQMLVEGLKASNVDLSYVAMSARASMLAFVNLKDGQPQYAFVDEGSAARMLSPAQISKISDGVTTMHFGSISLINEPVASTLEQLAKANKDHCIISLDPNIRPSVVVDRETYLARLERMIALADIIKISDEDMDWIYPNADHKSYALKWLAHGTALVIITRGGEGATAFTKAHEVDQPVEKVTVFDTVGAGDTFTAGLLSSLEQQGLLQREQLAHISAEQLKQATKLAAHAAAITVSRTGANPPWSHEI